MSKKANSNQEKNYLESVTDKVGEIAMHYGFTIIKPPHVSNDDISKSKEFKDFDYYGDVEEKIALTRWYVDGRHDTEAQPILVHYKKPLPGSSIRKKPNQEMYSFEIMGSVRPTSEALIIKCALAVLEELGYSDLYIDINSIGDRESVGKFEHELSAYYRKQAHTMPARLRQEFKKNHYSILTETETSSEIEIFIQNAPQPISSLSDISRLHFKEVLECIEAFDVAYKIKSNVLSNKLYASYTVFEIRQLKDDVKATTEGELLAYGYRYNHLAKKIGAKREVPSMGATILIKKNTQTSKKIIIKNIKKPRFYLVQLGETAKLKALNVVEMLRKHKIPVYHSITKDKITGQLSGAEYMRASHVLIMGQKEALENSIVVRNVVSREQETIPLTKLVEFLKNLDKSPK